MSYLYEIHNPENDVIATFRSNLDADEFKAACERAESWSTDYRRNFETEMDAFEYYMEETKSGERIFIDGTYTVSTNAFD